MDKIFNIKIKIENAAFEGNKVYEELPRILRDLAANIEAKNEDNPLIPISIYDINGNYVGNSWISKEV